MPGYGKMRYGHGPYSKADPPDPPPPVTAPAYSYPAGVRYGTVPLSRFSGEPASGLLSGSRGLVFFSPALLSPSSASEIDLSSLSVTARPSDVYSRPAEMPRRLFRFGGGAGFASGWHSFTNSPVYQSQPLEYSVVATLVQTTPPGPTTVIKVA